MDIVVANSWAKSLLRAVSQEWAAAHSNVDYFPSYEIVQNSDRREMWEDDLRHVKGAGVQHIMDVVPTELHRMTLITRFKAPLIRLRNASAKA